ncbi:hypothetical protein BDN72DRAFT_847356 [Pluteus cervinus]|uniref:Uncharacterized protein n=1 Tax=Pluteus cervinus TaxID=181527 RepID=A0ACD3ADM3_9AGAR|nr:hypothetical protein BDN72DRAFT_847356 [Pluteus cervinus]
MIAFYNESSLIANSPFFYNVVTHHHHGVGTLPGANPRPGANSLPRERIHSRARSRKSEPKRTRPNFGVTPSQVVELYPLVELRLVNRLSELDAWKRPSNDDMLDIWNKVYKSDLLVMFGISATDPRYEYGKIKGAKSLMKRTLNQWTPQLRECGLKAVRGEILHRFNPETDVQAIADWVRFMVGPLEDLSSKDRPFIWQSRDNANTADDVVLQTDENGQLVEVKHGKFYGCMVARTLACHLQYIQKNTHPGDPFVPTQRPRGALMMSIQAVHRALLFWASGKYIPPSDQPEYSKANWGDVYTRTRRLHQRRSTVFKKDIDDASDEDWAAIRRAAEGYMTAGQAEDSHSGSECAMDGVVGNL